MKSMTILLVASGFAAGVLIGMSGPLAKAGDGLTRMLTRDSLAAARVVHVTAGAELQRDGFQPADFRWNSHDDLTKPTVCAPQDQIGHAAAATIQHL